MLSRALSSGSGGDCRCISRHTDLRSASDHESLRWYSGNGSDRHRESGLTGDALTEGINQGILD